MNYGAFNPSELMIIGASELLIIAMGAIECEKT